jgi:stress-induced morphogen
VRDTIQGVNAELIRSLLEGAFPEAAIEIVDRTGGGDHFHVAVTSPAFDGIALIEQHRLVNRALAEPIGDGTIHELRISTKGST